MQQGSNHGNPVNRNHPWKQPPTGTIKIKRISVENTYQTITQDPDQRGWEGRDRNLPRFAAKTRQVFGKKKNSKKGNCSYYRKSSIKPPLSNKPPSSNSPPPFQGKKVNKPPSIFSSDPLPSPNYSTLINERLY